MYKNLRIIGYENNEKAISEYNLRFNSISTIRTGLIIHPFSIQQKRRITEKKFELFCTLYPDLVKIKDDIFLNSKTIDENINLLPYVAKNRLVISQLINEIQSTNEIEGVMSTKMEIADVISKSDKNKRFNGIANMYKEISYHKMNQIHSVTEIREIYDKLLSDEIEEKDKPDGNLFRTRVVYVGNDNKIVHQGDPSEEIITKNLENLIVFMNDSDVPLLIKAIITHYYFEYIHPFYDGNGRMGRFLFSSYIARKLDIFSGISISEAIMKTKHDYENLFMEASHPKNLGDLTPFIYGIMKLIKKSQLNMLDNIRIQRKKLDIANNFVNNQEIGKNHKKVLYIMIQNHLFDSNGFLLSNIDLHEITDLSRYAIDKITEELEKTGYIKLASKKPISYMLSTKITEIIE